MQSFSPDTLPLLVTPLVGRDREVAGVSALVRHPATRLVTLTGPGGVGKSRLAIRVAAGVSADFTDGVTFVDLAAVTEPAMVPLAVAHAVGAHETEDRSLHDALVQVCQNRHGLLVLDNFEQVADAAPFVAELLSTSPALNILVTSRRILRLSGEHEFPVPPLLTPNPDELPPLEELASCGSVALFVRRAQAARPDFRLTEANAVDVAMICVRVDGLPLAIELAAAKSKILSPHALLARLSNRLHLLSGGLRDLPARLQTMREAIAWSYDLLPADEQWLFRRFAVFSGGFLMDAAEFVCALTAETAVPDPDLKVLDGLSGLVDNNLLSQDEQPDGELRFRMLETIREFGIEQLTIYDELAAVRQRHAAWCVALAERAEPRLWGPDQTVWLDRLDLELDNLRAAMTWLNETGDSEQLLRLAGAMWWFWGARGYLADGWRWLNLSLSPASVATLPVRCRLKVMYGASMVAAIQGNYREAIRLADEGIALARDSDDQHGAALGHWMRSFASGNGGDHVNAAADAEQALAAFRSQGDDLWRAFSLNRLGIALFEQGALAEAEPLFQDALLAWRRLGHAWGVSTVLVNLALIALAGPDVQRAAALYRESLDIA